MSTYREYLPNSCKQLHFPDNSGNTIYMHISPEAKGDISLKVYKDERCTLPAKLSIEEYIEMFYKKEGDSEKGQSIARAWTKAIKRWNKHMSVYKICQPCRAHNLASGEDVSFERLLAENDGEGDAEDDGEGKDEEDGGQDALHGGSGFQRSCAAMWSTMCPLTSAAF